MITNTSNHEHERGAVAFVVALIVLALFVGIAVFFALRNAQAPTDEPTQEVANFQECADAGYAIMESYPRQCRTPQGQLFVENIGNELEKQDLIRLETPRPNELVESPLTVRGEARGTWYFEASFPVRLLDGNGNEIAIEPAQAQGEWMTEEFVPFEVELVFDAPTTDTGTLVLEKDNPSGLPEHADELFIPIRFDGGEN